jgi:DNA-3-methyladenine glycosylase I
MSPEADADGQGSRSAHADPLRQWYSTEIWGKRAQDDDALFEVMSLQVFQAGLTWNLILSRRDAFRRAFEGWQIDRVAAMGPPAIESMLQDRGIIRNRKKIEACIENARTIQELQREHGTFCGWFYQVMEGDDLAGLQKTLRSTFKFMGPEIARMWLLASGRISAAEGRHE